MRWTEAVTPYRISRDVRCATFYPAQTLASRSSARSTWALCGHIMQIDDLSDRVYATELHEGIQTIAVGWLGNCVPTSGMLSGSIILALNDFRQHAFHPSEDLGEHDCELCNDYSDAGELWLDHHGKRFVAPSMLVHYCEEHDYLPPKVFLDALMDWANRRE